MFSNKLKKLIEGIYPTVEGGGTGGGGGGGIQMKNVHTLCYYAQTTAHKLPKITTEIEKKVHEQLRLGTKQGLSLAAMSMVALGELVKSCGENLRDIEPVMVRLVEGMADHPASEAKAAALDAWCVYVDALDTNSAGVSPVNFDAFAAKVMKLAASGGGATTGTGTGTTTTPQPTQPMNVRAKAVAAMRACVRVFDMTDDVDDFIVRSGQRFVSVLLDLMITSPSLSAITTTPSSSTTTTTTTGASTTITASTLSAAASASAISSPSTAPPTSTTTIPSTVITPPPLVIPSSQPPQQPQSAQQQQGTTMTMSMSKSMPLPPLPPAPLGPSVPSITSSTSNLTSTPSTPSTSNIPSTSSTLPFSPSTGTLAPPSSSTTTASSSSTTTSTPSTPTEVTAIDVAIAAKQCLQVLAERIKNLTITSLGQIVMRYFDEKKAWTDAFEFTMATMTAVMHSVKPRNHPMIITAIVKHLDGGVNHLVQTKKAIVTVLSGMFTTAEAAGQLGEITTALARQMAASMMRAGAVMNRMEGDIALDKELQVEIIKAVRVISRRVVATGTKLEAIESAMERLNELTVVMMMRGSNKESATTTSTSTTTSTNETVTTTTTLDEESLLHWLQFVRELATSVTEQFKREPKSSVINRVLMWCKFKSSAEVRLCALEILQVLIADGGRVDSLLSQLVEIGTGTDGNGEIGDGATTTTTTTEREEKKSVLFETSQQVRKTMFEVGVMRNNKPEHLRIVWNVLVILLARMRMKEIPMSIPMVFGLQERMQSKPAVQGVAIGVMIGAYLKMVGRVCGKKKEMNEYVEEVMTKTLMMKKGKSKCVEVGIDERGMFVVKKHRYSSKTKEGADVAPTVKFERETIVEMLCDVSEMRQEHENLREMLMIEWGTEGANTSSGKVMSPAPMASTSASTSSLSPSSPPVAPSPVVASASSSSVVVTASATSSGDGSGDGGGVSITVTQPSSQQQHHQKSTEPQQSHSKQQQQPSSSQQQKTTKSTLAKKIAAHVASRQQQRSSTTMTKPANITYKDVLNLLSSSSTTGTTNNSLNGENMMMSTGGATTSTSTQTGTERMNFNKMVSASSEWEMQTQQELSHAMQWIPKPDAARTCMLGDGSAIDLRMVEVGEHPEEIDWDTFVTSRTLPSWSKLFSTVL